MSQVLAEDNNEYLLIEASDWVTIAKDEAKDQGKLRKPARDGLIDFLGWYAAQGIYTQAYTIIRKVYTPEDSKAIQNWILDAAQSRWPIVEFHSSLPCIMTDLVLPENNVSSFFMMQH